MPEISRFFGIIIRMYTEPNAPHHESHFHAYYQEFSAVFGWNAMDLIGGDMPRKQERLILKWAKMYKDELKENWKLLQSGELPNKIEPLR